MTQWILAETYHQRHNRILPLFTSCLVSAQVAHEYSRSLGNPFHVGMRLGTVVCQLRPAPEDCLLRAVVTHVHYCTTGPRTRLQSRVKQSIVFKTGFGTAFSEFSLSWGLDGCGCQDVRPDKAFTLTKHDARRNYMKRKQSWLLPHVCCEQLRI